MYGVRTSNAKGPPWTCYVPPAPVIPHEETEAARLIRVITLEDRTGLQNLLRAGADPNSCVDEFGATPMHVAAGCTAKSGAWMLDEMVRAGGNPNVSDRIEKLTPVHLACIANRVECLRVLVEHGGDPLAKSRDNYTALGYARKYGAGDCVGLLTSLQSSETPRPALATLNGGARLERHSSGSSLNSQYHSACSSLGKVDRPLPSPVGRKKAQSIYPDADYDSGGDAYISPTVLVRKSVLKRSTSGNRAVPRTSSKSNSRYSIGFSSDSDDGQAVPSRISGKPRASSLGRSSSGAAPKSHDQSSSVHLKSLSKSDSRGNSSNDVEHQGRGRRLSGLGDLKLDDLPRSSEPEISAHEYAKFAAVTDQDIRQQLREMGADPGPINSSHDRTVYINRLVVLKRGRRDPEGKVRSNGLTSCSLSVPRDQSHTSFCSELKQVIAMQYDKDQMQLLEQDFRAIFRAIPKTSFSFTYLLVDPLISQNLAHQVNEGTEANLQRCFKVFLRSIFYIGKGKNSRPMQHLVDAKRVFINRSLKTSPKLDRICQIWDRSHGVVCVRLFDHRGEEESYSRESLMIEALGKDKLCNERRGSAYGELTTWSSSRRKLLGSSFLLDAFHHILVTGELQIFPQDIRV